MRLLLPLFAMALTLVARPAAGQPVQLTSIPGLSGTTLGPGGALYVTQFATGSVLRIDPQTGDVTTFATGLPLPLAFIGFGGAMDVAFVGSTAYVLVSLVDPGLGGTHTAGIYRVDGPNSFSLVADLGAFSLANPPTIDFQVDVPFGVHYTLEPFHGGFLVTDGHLNRVLRVTPGGAISIYRAFGNIVPTGLAIRDNTVYMAHTGPQPHLPEDGRIVAFGPGASPAVVIAAGASMLLDVEFGRGGLLYGLAQGTWNGIAPGSPAIEHTGSLVRVNDDGSFTTVAMNINQPTSMEFIGNTAYITTLGAGVWRIDDVSAPPFGPTQRR